MARAHRIGAAVAVAALLSLTGCGDSTPSGSAPTGEAEQRGGDARGSASPSPSPEREPVDPASVDADELGAVPVLMYHQIVPDPVSVYDRTPEDFRTELERLAREGYVPVTARDLTGGRIDVPAGRHPVVLTFDDSTVSQLALGADGKPESGTAVAILRDVAEEHPGFRPVATFFVNGDPFAEPGGSRTLGWLHEHGFEVGNHTLRHTRLGAVGAAQVQRAIARGQAAVEKAVPDASVVSLALPNGSMPDDERLAVKGSSGGVDYHNRGVYLVGANPAPSPFDADFDPAAVPRIRSQGSRGPDAGFASTAWLDKLESGAVDRYTSDGDPDRVSFPAEKKPDLADAFQDAANPY
jgi:peptidoglycan/xylan/chitin deacetylase (PgdA/CDA1 family)